MKNINPSENAALKNFSHICTLSDLKEGSGKRFIVNDVDIAVFKIEGNIFALSNVCPHQHTTMIYDGYVEDGRVACPIHGWMFDIKTGKMPMGRAGLDVYPVIVEGRNVYVKVHQKEINW
jgi:nitrite reductase/ring-hydroxylating ferredoxin subunit